MMDCPHEETCMGLCTDCGLQLRSGDGAEMTDFSKLIAVTRERASRVEKAVTESLLRRRKLSLVLDLDETLVSTSREAISVGPDGLPVRCPALVAFETGGANIVVFRDAAHGYVLRPHLAEFLGSMVELFDLHLCTFGSDEYACEMLKIIDPTGGLFHGRATTRDDGPEVSEVVFSDGAPEMLRLKQIVPAMGGPRMCLVVDDRADVWKSIPNLVRIQPFKAFPLHGGDALGDQYLLHIAEELRRVHRRFYEIADSGVDADVCCVVAEVRRSTAVASCASSEPLDVMASLIEDALCV